MNFTDRLKTLMRNKSVYWKQVSEDLGIGKNQLRYWEENGLLPDGKTLIKLSQYFGVSFDYLLLGEESINISRKNNTLINSINESPNSALNVGQTFTQQELELIEIFRSFSLKQQLELMNYMFGLREEK